MCDIPRTRILLKRHGWEDEVEVEVGTKELRQAKTLLHDRLCQIPTDQTKTDKPWQHMNCGYGWRLGLGCQIGYCTHTRATCSAKTTGPPIPAKSDREIGLEI
jgi:hypothetical protein